MLVVPSTTWISRATLSSVGTLLFPCRSGWHAPKSPRYGYEVVNARDDIAAGLQPPTRSRPVEWQVGQGLTSYEAALAVMEARAAAVADGTASELVWLIEHPPLYTAGTSAKPAELLDPARFPVFATGRGGQYTYHGP